MTPKLCQQLLSIISKAISTMNGNDNTLPKQFRKPTEKSRSFGVDMHYIVFSKRTIKSREE
jgi:hypothetical protein